MPRPARWFAILFMGVLAVAQAAEEKNDPPKQRAGLPVAALNRTSTVDFEKEILPFFKTSCLACHNQTKAKASLILETPQHLLKGGDSGPAVVPGKSAESLVFKAAAHSEDPIMPPKDNKSNAPNLTAEQLALLKLWIDQGAKGEVHGDGPIAWQALTERVNPIFAVALSPDGQFAAAGRGNQIFVYHLQTGALTARLSDAALGGRGLYTNAMPAHLDLVNALAFSPDGQWLASGGYREIKLWRRPRNVQTFALAAAHEKGARVVAASPDGKWLATGGEDGVIKLWSAATGVEGGKLSGHTAAVSALVFSTDGRRLFSGSRDTTVRVWDVENAKQLTRTSASSEVNALAHFAKQNQLAVATADKFIQILVVPGEGEEFKLVHDLKGHDGAVTALAALSGADDRLLSGSADGTVRVWNMQKGEVAQKLDHGSPVTSVAARPDGRRFASAGGNAAKLWQASDGKLVAELTGDRYAREAVTQSERMLAFAKSQFNFRKGAVESAEKERTNQVARVRKATETIVTTEKALAEKQKLIEDAKTNQTNAEKALVEVQENLKKAKEAFEAAEAAALAAKKEASEALERSAQTLLAERAAQIKAGIEKITAETFAAVSKSASSPIPAGEAAGVSTNELKATAEAKLVIGKALDELAVKASAASLAKTSYERLKSESEGKEKQANEKLTAAKKAVDDADKELKKAELARSTTENEMHLAIAGASKAADVLNEAQNAVQFAEAEQKKYETELAAVKQNWEASQKAIRAVAFSPDNLTLATAGDDWKVHTWSAGTGTVQETYQGHGANVLSVAFTDSSALASVSADQSTVVWNLQPAWKLERTIGTGDADSPLVDRVTALRFMPDGRALISGGGEPSRSAELKLWNPANGQLVQELKNVHSDVVYSLDVTPDGKFLASGAADRFAKVVELATGKVTRSFEGHTHHVLGVSWKRDARTLVSAGADNVVKVWDVITGDRKKNIDGFGKEVTWIGFVGDTDQAIACSGDNTVRAVKDNGEKGRAYEGASDFMNTAAVSFDGKVVVAGGQDSVLHVWDGSDGQLVALFGPPRL